MDEDKKKLVTYVGIGGAVLVVIYLVMKKGATTTSSGSNNSQPIIVPASSSDTNSSTQTALTDIVASQSAIATGLNTIADSNAQTLQGMKDIGTLIDNQAKNNLPITVAAPIVEPKPVDNSWTLFGASADISSAEGLYGMNNSNVKFMDTTGMTNSQVRTLMIGSPHAMIVGGDQAKGGVSAEASAGTGITRIGGKDRADTLRMLQSVNF